MNTMNSESNRRNLKFTRGEKCLFAHLVITFSFILGFLVLYLIHLYLVNHNLTGVFNTRRSFAIQKAHPKPERLPIGLIFLNQKPIITICNILLLTPQWSVGPGHCIAMRSDPDLSHLINVWRLKYKYNLDIKIKKDVVHANFNRNTLVNNIGLVKHVTIRGIQGYGIQMNHNILYTKELDNIVIASWDHDTIYKGKDIGIYSVRLMEAEQCSSHLAPIAKLRKYEFCVAFQRNQINALLGHGAPIINQKNNQVLGYFTWGEREQFSLPLIVLNLTNFYEWLEITSIDSSFG